MPVRSLNSSVLVWPNRRQVNDAVRRWALNEARSRQEIRRIGYFGSYARGDWGVGSDLDLVIVVERTEEPVERRAARWPTTALPVDADVLVYTSQEWESLLAAAGRFGKTLRHEAVWL